MDEGLRREFALHKAKGGKGRLLNRCQEILEAVPPSSVQPEQDFSVLNFLLGDHRASLKSTTLDDIFMLRKAYEYEI